MDTDRVRYCQERLFISRDHRRLIENASRSHDLLIKSLVSLNFETMLKRPLVIPSHQLIPYLQNDKNNPSTLHILKPPSPFPSPSLNPIPLSKKPTIRKCQPPTPKPNPTPATSPGSPPSPLTS